MTPLNESLLKEALLSKIEVEEPEMSDNIDFSAGDTSGDNYHSGTPSNEVTYEDKCGQAIVADSGEYLQYGQDCSHSDTSLQFASLKDFENSTTLTTSVPAVVEGCLDSGHAFGHAFDMPSLQLNASQIDPSFVGKISAPWRQGHNITESHTINTYCTHCHSQTVTNAKMMGSPSHFSSYPPLDSVAGIHEAQPYMTQQVDRDYHQMADLREFEAHDFKTDQPRYPSPSGGANDNMFGGNHQPPSPDRVVMTTEPNNDGMDGNTPSPPRSRAIPKPEREPIKGADGRYYCNLEGCQEEVRDFNRRCEYNKHMDKHERPYKCGDPICDKLPGFTYSGGLLRHEREVHNKHGGPKRQLNCPHKSCKRYTGKGFSRQENLNEHIRRVHTSATDAGDGILLNGTANGDDTEEDALGDVQAGQKRKRTTGRSDVSDIHEQLKRVKQENEDLTNSFNAQTHLHQAQAQQIEAQAQQIRDMADQIQALQQVQMAGMHMHQQMQAPPAQML